LFGESGLPKAGIGRNKIVPEKEVDSGSNFIRGIIPAGFVAIAEKGGRLWLR